MYKGPWEAWRPKEGMVVVRLTDTVHLTLSTEASESPCPCTFPYKNLSIEFASCRVTRDRFVGG